MFRLFGLLLVGLILSFSGSAWGEVAPCIDTPKFTNKKIVKEWTGFNELAILIQILGEKK